MFFGQHNIKYSKKQTFRKKMMKYLEKNTSSTSKTTKITINTTINLYLLNIYINLHLHIIYPVYLYPGNTIMLNAQSYVFPRTPCHVAKNIKRLLHTVKQFFICGVSKYIQALIIHYNEFSGVIVLGLCYGCQDKPSDACKPGLNRLVHFGNYVLEEQNDQSHVFLCQNAYNDNLLLKLRFIVY